MNFKKIKAFLTLFTLILPLEIKANDYQFLKAVNTSNSVEIYGVNANGTSTLLNTYLSTNATTTHTGSNFQNGLVDQYNGKVYLLHTDFEPIGEIGAYGSIESYYLSYDLLNNKIEKVSNTDIVQGKTIIYPEGIKALISKKEDGSVHIGENSAVFKEENGVEKFWATDASGQSIPINITNGSKLLINGRDVEQSIDNVGALSAALTGLPTVPTDSPVACGIGTGLHGGNYAFSGGCASKVNEKLSFNAAASFVPGQDYQGVDNSYSARAGFVFKLGKINKKELTTKKENQLDQKVSHLQTENKELKSLIAKQNSRLEKLEEIALALKMKKDLEVISMAE